MNPPLSNLASIAYILPEVVLVAGILAIVCWDLAARRKLEGIVGIALAAHAGSAGIALAYASSSAAPRILFGGLLAFDPYANFFRVFFALATSVVIVFSYPLPAAGGGAAKGKGAGEFYTLLLAVSLGMNFMAMARNLLMIYLSLELVSVISFVLAGFAFERRSAGEAALKYVVFGGFSSGVMLYGMSWLFGVSGSLDLAAIARAVADPAHAGQYTKAVFVAVVCVLAGFGYKISAAPFHMWAPDVYEGSPTPVTAFLSVGPKAAGFAVMIRFFHDALGANAAAAAGADVPWSVVAGVMALATMTIGNLSALGQTSTKRMLAYSSIAHAGYMLLGFCVFSDAGVASIVFYIAVYCFMNLGAFLVVLALEEQTGSDSIEQFAGLGRRAPVLAIPMAIFLVSLTGLPPMAGFVGKFYLFAALLQRPSQWSTALALGGVFNSVISLFYYARILRAMYLAPAREGASPTVDVRRLYGYAALALAVPTVLLGVYWPPVYSLVERALVMAP